MAGGNRGPLGVIPGADVGGPLLNEAPIWGGIEWPDVRGEDEKGADRGPVPGGGAEDFGEEEGNAPGAGLDANGGGCDTGVEPVGPAVTMFGGNVVWVGALGGTGPLGKTPCGGGPGLVTATDGGCWLNGELLEGLAALPPRLLDCC